MASQPSHDDAVASFMSVTAVGDAAVARRCLESCSFNVEEAIGLFFSMGADAFAVPPPAPAAGGAAAALPASSSSSGGTSEADARAIAAALAEDADEAGAAAPMRTRSSTSGSPAVRAPDAVKRQRHGGIAQVTGRKQPRNIPKLQGGSPSKAPAKETEERKAPQRYGQRARCCGA